MSEIKTVGLLGLLVVSLTALVQMTDTRECGDAPPSHMGPRATHDHHLRCGSVAGSTDCPMCNWTP